MTSSRCFKKKNILSKVTLFFRKKKLFLLFLNMDKGKANENKQKKNHETHSID